VLPVISDTVILPRVLDPSRVKSVINSFSRATRKCIRDSLLVAGITKYKEDTMAKVGAGSLIS
jgi:hypothetical protein